MSKPIDALPGDPPEPGVDQVYAFIDGKAGWVAMAELMTRPIHAGVPRKWREGHATLLADTGCDGAAVKHPVRGFCRRVLTRLLSARPSS